MRINPKRQNGRRAAILNLIMAVSELIQRLVLIYPYAKYEVDSLKNVDLNACQLKKTKWPPDGHFEFHEHDF